ncbi:dienelactone hydrolase family protein [Bradyrhizobium sp. NAS96.2]|uniref:dienelactone hydrolase family protein n=1 Tax=Bradyrhizobium sp. NAS96.2 TaxID=1680160 RepID=UPI00093924BD|nr:dienelactone hydrolase family protein [Bradyrhizobium sp. NAS96.2]OKO77740.1 carboxymethylenebutenolidase [Bradyrhizobium sp. NAS96.2]
MPAISRRSLLGGLAVLAASPSLAAATAETLTVDAGESPVTLSRFAAGRAGKRPAVLVLHGSRGFDLRPQAYERYANALTADGIDAYFVRYYTPADEQAFETMHTRERREAYETGRFDAWAARVSSVLTTVLAGVDSSGRVGLLGFSLGGYVAAAAAARDERVSALAVLYGGMPDKIAPQVKHLPPMIELHGEADRNVPLASGEQLVKLGKSVGAAAEIVRYPGKAHGFDFADNDPMTADAVSRVAGFFQARLSAA